MKAILNCYAFLLAIWNSTAITVVFIQKQKFDLIC